MLVLLCSCLISISQLLTKKEMRFIRHYIKNQDIKSPEKCGKKFMKYCDINRDNHVDIEELLICTEVRKKTKRKQRKSKT